MDSYVPDVRRFTFASNILYSKCMRENNIVVPVEDPDDTIPSTRNSVLRSLFDVSIAERYGYHAGPARQASVGGPALTSAEKAVGAQCTSSAQSALHFDSKAVAAVQHRALVAEMTAMRAAPFRTAARRWAACMTPLHVPDLPASPVDMPTTSQRAKFHRMDRPGALPGVTRASAYEIRQATFDARCRESSRFSDTFYGLDVQQQLEVLQNEPSALASALSRNRRTNTSVSRVLAAR